MQMMIMMNMMIIIDADDDWGSRFGGSRGWGSRFGEVGVGEVVLGK